MKVEEINTPLPPGEAALELAREGSRELVATAELLRSSGLPVAIISAGGTGTYGISGVYPGITEIQAGSYLLMDDLYVDRDPDSNGPLPF